MPDTPRLSSLEGCELPERSDSSPRGITFVQRTLVVFALVAVAFSASLVAPSQAEAVTWNGCNWAGFCSVKFNKAETAGVAAGAYASLPPSLPKVVLIAIAGSAAYAAERGLCTQVNWNKHVIAANNNLSHLVPRIVPTTFRCG